MAYTFRYRLQSSPQPMNDGSGMVAHDIFAIASSDGETWEPVPARHKTILTPGDELQVVMDMDNGASKVAEYKQLLVDNVNTVGVPSSRLWTVEAMDILMTVNDAVESVALEANDYITVTLHQTYPVDFNL